ncbi:MAG: hypothetical protein NVS3B12_34420 [Acidimicrobiales bacterium]
MEVESVIVILYRVRPAREGDPEVVDQCSDTDRNAPGVRTVPQITPIHALFSYPVT